MHDHTTSRRPELEGRRSLTTSRRPELEGRRSLDPLARVCRPGLGALRGIARADDGDQIPRTGLARRRALALLGPHPLCAHPGALFRLAGECIPRFSLLRRAPPGGPAGDECAARVGTVRRLERTRCAAGLGAGSERGESTARMGRVPSSCRRRGDAGNDPGRRPVRCAAASTQGIEPLRLGLVYPRRPDVYPARLPGRQCGAPVPARRTRGDVQRTVDPRRRGLVCHAAGAGDRLCCHPRRLRKADLQPLPVDDRVLGAVFDLPTQRYPPLHLLVDPDGGPKRGSRRIGLPCAPT